MQMRLQSINIESLCKDIDCDFETKDSYVYSISHRDKLEAEIQALEKIGYNAEYVRNIPLPMENQGAVRFSGQAQFHPLKFVASMADSLHIYEHTKITEPCNRFCKDGTWYDNGRSDHCGNTFSNIE